MTLIDDLNWRYATKKFDPAKKLTSDELDFLKEAIRLTATSYGLQPFKVIIVEDDSLKAKLKPSSYGQNQITDASHLFVFCNLTKINTDLIDYYVKLSAETRNLDVESLSGYGNFMKSTIGELKPEALSNWTAKQAYIAMSNLLTACAELRIDSCPIEGFLKDEYNAILELNELGLEAAVAVSVGYRAEDDKAQFATKVRLSQTDLFI